MTSYAPPKLRQIVTEAVFRRKRLFWPTVVVVVALVTAVTLVMPKKFRSDAKLMVQNVRSQAPLTTTPTDRLMTANEVSTEEINSEVDLLQSEAVARRALGQDTSHAVNKQQESEIQTLEHHLTVDAVHQTNLIDVSLLANSPQAANEQLRQILNAFFEERAGTALSTGAADFFEKQVALKAQQIQNDQQQLTDFQVAHGIADLDDQKKLQVDQIASLEGQRLAAQAQLAAQRSKVAADKRQLSLTPERSRTTIRTITNQYSQEHLNTELVDLENHRTELTKRYQPTDRLVQEVDEKIATTKQAIAAEAQHPAGEESTDINPVYQQLNEAVATSQGEASAMAAQAAELAVQLTQAKARLDALEQATAVYDELKRNLAQAQADYTLYAGKRDEARIAEDLDKARMFNVSLVQAPMASTQAVRPKPVLYIAAGTVFAFFLATLLALYVDTSSEQVYTPAQLDALTGTRTIATFAEETEKDAAGNRLEYRRVLLAIRRAVRASEESGEGARSGHQAAVAQLNGEAAGYCIAFCSALRGEGVSYLASHLATEAARQAGSRVAVLDVAHLLRKFEAEQDVGFGLRYDARGEHWVLDLTGAQSATAPRPQQGSVHGLFSARLRPLLVDMRKEFDFILLDCPSLQQSTLAAELDRAVDGYVAVIAAATSRKQNIEGLTATFRETQAPLLGYVLNRRTYPVPRWMHRALWA